MNRSRLGQYENSKNFKNKLLKGRFWDVQKRVIFKKRNFSRNSFFEKKKFIFAIFQPKFWKWKNLKLNQKNTFLVRSGLWHYKNSTKYQKNELKSQFFEVLPKSVFYCEKKYYGESSYVISVQKSFVPAKKMLRWITLCEKCSKVVCSCQKYYALIYAMFEAFKSIFFPAKKKTSIYAVSRVDFFPAKKRRIFAISTASTSRHVTPRHV